MSAPKPEPLQVFYGISSPWAYFGAQRAAQIARAAGVKLVLRPIRIIEANGGIPLRQRPQARQGYHQVELDRWRKHLGIELNLRPRFYPCRTIEPAAQAVIAAQLAGRNAGEFSFAIQRALWAQDRDIADLDTLRELAAATLGEQGPGFVREHQPDPVQDAWRENLDEARRIGIFGTPTYVVGDELFWGQDRLDFVARALASAHRPQTDRQEL